MSKQALAGLRVIEYADYISGPFCAKLMSDLGAEVIKIEPPGGDSARRAGPFPQDIPDPEKSGLFLFLNTNKQSLTLDLEKPEAIEIFRELIKSADVLVENYPVPHLGSLGLGYDALHSLNPRLVMTSITPFGQNGPYSHYKGNDLICSHMSGIAYHTPFPGVLSLEDNPPLKPGGHQGDFLAGSSAAVATMFAVMAREREGEGQHIDVSEQEALVSCMRRLIPFYTYDPEGMYKEWCSTRISNRGGLGHLPCLDGFITNGCREEYQWRALLELVDGKDWEKDERISSLFTSGFDLYILLAKFEKVKPILTEWTMKHTKEEVARLAQARGIPIVPCNSAAELFSSPQVAAQNFFIEVDHPRAGKLLYPGVPYKFSGTPAKVVAPAPLLGEHTEEVLRGLGYSKDDIESFKRAGAI